MTFDGWVELIDKGAVVALAVFAILMLQREYKRQLDDRAKVIQDGAEERRQLIQVIERNTQAWAEATNTMTSVAAGIAVLTECIGKTEEDVHQIRVLLARRPCIGPFVADDPEE